VKNSEVRLF